MPYSRTTFSVTLLLLLTFAFSATDAQAQRRNRKKVEEVSIYDIDTLQAPIPRQRDLFHTYINREQLQADRSDGKADGGINVSDDPAVVQMISKALFQDVDQMQIMIENMPVEGDPQTQIQTKIRYLVAVRSLLQRYNRDAQQDPFNFRRQTTNLRDMIIARNEGKLEAFARNHANWASLENAELLEGYPDAYNYIYKTVGLEFPKLMIRRLNEYATAPFACDIIAAAAKVVPNEVFNFATSTNYKYKSAVRSCTDPTVQGIMTIANESKSPLKAMPFLTQVVRGTRTVAEVDKITADQDLYFKALVALKIQEGKSLGESYERELQYRGLKYVRTMNDLHESGDAVRFRCVDGFTPEQLYYIVVYGQDELYTSSFLGMYKRIQERMKGGGGDALLDSVHYDKFRTFIRMAAGYNVLTPFLATMPEDTRVTIMKQFMANLEQGPNDDLEDAVDVADAYSSIEDKELEKILTTEVKRNYERCKNINSKKGIIVYGLLSALFQGEVNGDELGLPPVTRVPYESLTDSAGVVYQQVYFYGDEDGRISYQSFMGNFGGNWKVQKEKEWTVISSTAGKPVVIYANLPLTEPQDEEAQTKLRKHLSDKNIRPTIVIHRGHSYHLPLTLEGLQKETKLVMLGSCGGYHNLGTVMDRSPDAQIISTKQTGTMSVNEPIVQAINTNMTAGKTIEWPQFWKDLGTQFAKKGGDPLAKFKDYVPPNKNLGALFIKAYRKIYNSEDV